MRKKIKIIDLFCYISVGEYDKLPVEFEYAGYYWFWCLSCLTYETRDDDNKEINLYDYLARNGDLNDEVEIIEDEFEDIERIIYPDLNEDYEYELQHKNIEEIYDTINQLIKNQKKIIERLKED